MKPATLKLFTNIKDFHAAYELHYIAGVKPQAGTFGKLSAIRIGNRFKSQPIDNIDWVAELRRQLKEINKPTK